MPVGKKRLFLHLIFEYVKMLWACLFVPSLSLESGNGMAKKGCGKEGSVVLCTKAGEQ